jgi:cyclic pyranopterin monophosphate synthase
VPPPSPIESAVYVFEGLLPELESPPIAARRALDHAGLRMSIEGWRSLPAEDRQKLALAGLPERIDVNVVADLAVGASPQPQRVPPGADPDPSSPPEALARALAPARSIDPKRWAKLRSLDRYALAHTYRRAVARSSFLILGEAFDAVLTHVKATPMPRRRPLSSPSPAGAYMAPGAYSNVTDELPPSRDRGEARDRHDPRADVRPPPLPQLPSPSEYPSQRPPAHVSPSQLPPPLPSQVSTHVSPAGEVHMVPVGQKPATERRAIATGSVRMRPETAARITRRDAPKGEVLATARIAGIMAAKRTPELIPLCHSVALTGISVEIEIDAPGSRVVVTAMAEAFDRTGVEMEALVAASVACLTIYDMLKGVDRDMVIGEVRLLEKSGGRTGHYRAGDGKP